MVLKNVLKTGYPFVESIASSLPICDEFLISEGYSTDGTFEIVEKISKFNKKVKLFRQEWPDIKKYSVISEVTNSIRAKCNYNYIFSIQANEIIHEKSIELIKALPEICPMGNSFSLPFVHLVKDLKFYEDFRLRFAKNLKNIVSVGDAWTLGSSKSFTNSETLKVLIHPRRLRQYINKGIEWTYSNSCTTSSSRAIYLPKPIFRYWSLFPVDYLEKCKKHAEMFGLENLRNDIEILKKHLDEPLVFWEKAAEMRREELSFHYPDSLGMVNLDDHPQLMKGLLSDSNSTSYHIREEVLEMIKDL
jgi:hypothetical protein